MADQVKVTVGIATRNEERTIRQTLHTTIAALRRCDRSCEPQIIVALNGCTDQTEQRVREVITETGTDPRPIPIRIIHSEEGIITAQRAIAAARRIGDIIVFLDADLLIDGRCITTLVEAMRAPDIQIAWAQVIPYDNTRPRFKHLVLNFADYHPDVMTKRVYFSGRAFAIRDYNVPLASVDLRTIRPNVIRFLRLKAGPMIDDVFLSRAIIYQYGPAAIKYVPTAKVYFQPIASLKDFYYSQRRTIFERKRLNLLFPEQSYIVRKYYKRTIRKEIFNKLPFTRKLAYHLYSLLYRMVRKLSLIQYSLYGFLLEHNRQLPSHKMWPALKTTKKAFYNETTD